MGKKPAQIGTDIKDTSPQPPRVVKRGARRVSPKVRKRRVGERARRVVEALIDDPDMTLKKAGLKAGFTKSPAQQAHAALKSAGAQELFRRLMAARPKLKHSALADKLEQGLDAVQVKYFAHEGLVQDEREQVDFGTRATYLGLATRLAGLDPGSRMELTGAGGKDLIPAVQSLVVLPQLTKEQLLALLEVKEPADEPQVPKIEGAS